MSCCETWEAAQEPGAIVPLYRARCCPWCKADKRKPSALTIAAQAVVDARLGGGEWDVLLSVATLSDAITELANVLDTKPG